MSRAGDSDGRTSVAVSWDGAHAQEIQRGVIRLADGVKPTSAEAIAELKAMGIIRCCSPETTLRSPAGWLRRSASHPRT